jgi:hypothetical protein
VDAILPRERGIGASRNYCRVRFGVVVPDVLPTFDCPRSGRWFRLPGISGGGDI